VKVLDSDANTVLVLLGRQERSASQAPAAEDEDEDEESVRFSLLREAATVVSSRGGTTRVPGNAGVARTRPT
jgi:hypothetical protein